MKTETKPQQTWGLFLESPAVTFRVADLDLDLDLDLDGKIEDCEQSTN